MFDTSSKIEALRASVNERLRATNRRRLLEDIAEGDTVRTGAALCIDRVAHSIVFVQHDDTEMSRRKMAIIQGRTEFINKMETFNIAETVLMNAYIQLGHIAHRHLFGEQTIIEINGRSYYVSKSRGVPRSLYLATGEIGDHAKTFVVHNNQRRSAFPNFSASTLTEVVRNGLVAEKIPLESFDAVAAVGELAQTFAADMLGSADIING